ncbi:Conjugal transfer protein TraD [Rhizobiales bacterium GAS191]|nr:Conjugal transfer protein TraD [Rhizobiales bacterium GAS191]
MARTSLAERMSRLGQQKARIAEQEARIKTDERKARTRRLIEAGGLVEKAGLLHLDANALYGALLSLSSSAKNTARVTEWAKAGGHVFDREAKARDAGREPLTVTFAGALPTTFTTRLRGAGLRWNKVLQHWEGLAEHAVVAALAGEHGGTVHRVRPTGEQEKAAAAE